MGRGGGLAKGHGRWAIGGGGRGGGGSSGGCGGQREAPVGSTVESGAYRANQTNVGCGRFHTDPEKCAEQSQSSEADWTNRARPCGKTNDSWNAGCSSWNVKGSCASSPTLVPSPVSLPAQWRFVCRVLRRYAAEERVQNARRHLRLGDHIYVQRNSWDVCDQHALVCSAPTLAEDGYGARRGGPHGREESHWVVHWSSSRMLCTSLHDFVKGGELFRVTYPLWACQVYIPSSTTARPCIADEQRIEPASAESVAKQANNALRSGAWSPSWSQARDLEFCLHFKSGGRVLPWEIHTRAAVLKTQLAPCGCLLRGGDCSPSEMFSASNGTSSCAAGVAPTPVLQPSLCEALPQSNVATAGEQQACWDAQHCMQSSVQVWDTQPGWNTSWGQQTLYPPPAASQVAAAPLGAFSVNPAMSHYPQMMQPPVMFNPGLSAPLPSTAEHYIMPATAQDFVPGNQFPHMLQQPMQEMQQERPEQNQFQHEQQQCDPNDPFAWDGVYQ